MLSRILATLVSAIALLLSYSQANAANLCDPACDIEMQFTNGGSIHATDQLDIFFGIGGVLQLGAGGTLNVAVPPASLDYSAGGTLTLNAGESISFGPGGLLDLGDAGNIDYTTMDIDVDGSLSLDTTGSSGTITWLSGTLTVAGSWTNATNWTNSGSIELSSSITLSNSGTFNNLSTGSVSFIGGGVISGGNATLTVSDLNTSLTLSGGTITPINGGTITLVGGFTPSDLTADNLATFEGLLLTTVDGVNCTVTDGECLSTDGAKYVVNSDGELVLAGEGNGSFDLWLLVLMTGWLLQRRRFSIR